MTAKCGPAVIETYVSKGDLLDGMARHGIAFPPTEWRCSSLVFEAMVKDGVIDFLPTKTSGGTAWIPCFMGRLIVPTVALTFGVL